MTILTKIVSLIFSLAILKSVFFWVYLWQLKEYRLDRFWAEYGNLGKLLLFWLGSGGRRFHHPFFTLKAISIFLASILIMGLLILKALPVPSFLWPLFYLLTPFAVLLLVLFFKIPTFFAKRILHFLGRRKILRARELLVIGITGSYGKTSTKGFLYQVLAKKFNVAATPGHINTEAGIAKFILSKDFSEEGQIFIVEMGAYKRGEIRRICELVQPTIGILTGINEQHLALFGSVENIKKAKFELIKGLRPNGLAVFNGDNPHVRELAEAYKGKKIMYHVRGTLAGQLPPHYQLNLSAVSEVARYLGMSEGEIKEALKKIIADETMMKIFHGKGGALIIDDSYSSNPDGVFAALDYLASQTERWKFLIMPSLIELGGSSKEIHQKIGRKIKDICEFAIITTPDSYEDIKREAGEKTLLEQNPQEIARRVEPHLSSQSAILVEGRVSEEILEFLRQNSPLRRP